MFVLSFNAAHYFQWNFFLILIVFLNNARKSCTPFMEILFPHDKFLHGKILPRNPLSPIHPHPNVKESPWKHLYTS